MTTINTAIVSDSPALYQQFSIIRENQISLLAGIKADQELFNLNPQVAPDRDGVTLLNKFRLPAKVAINSGQLISIVADSGVAKFDLAQAPSLPAHGYCLESATAGSDCVCILFDGILNATGLTVGTKYYTSNSTGGAITATNTGTDHCIGLAISSTQILFHTRGVF